MIGLSDTSVIMPVLNGERFIREAVESVLAQLGDSDELLVINDGSTDNTLMRIELSDQRLKVLQGSRQGPSAARNVGLRVAGGTLIAFLDHDDVWPAGRHSAMAAALLADATLDAVAGRIRVFVEADGAIGNYDHMHGRYVPSLPWSCLFRRSLIDRVGMFDESLRFGEDLDYYVRLQEAGMKLGRCDQDALVYRRHASNATNAQPPQTLTALALVARKLARRRALG